MTTQIALDMATNDLIKLEGGGIARVKDGRYTVQLVKNRLLTMLGEWRLDPRVGWVRLEDFKRNPDLFDLEMRAKKIITSTKGVQMVDDMTLTLKSRKLTIAFTATTIYGKIDLTVPWSL